MVDQTRRYRLLEPVGHGSFGTVWRAIMETEGGFSKEVALKILRPEAAARLETVRRLRDEARLLGLLRHRSIVQVDGLIQVEGRWAVVMELVLGISLSDLIPETRMPLGVALEVLAEISSALHDAYSQLGPDGRPLRLIHRDIKPSNVRLAASGGVKVLDFGIARAEFDAREATTASLMLGTLAYMSPERLDSIDGPEGDIYALGAMFYELVVGERIGKTSSNPMRHEQLRQTAMARFAEITRLFGSEATELFGRMIAYEPRDRPAARELEITCRRIVRRLEGESLAEWAAREVPRVASHAELQLEPEDTQLTGVTLVEQRGQADLSEGATELLTEPLGEPTDQSLTIQEPSAAILPPAPLPQPAPPRHGPPLWVLTAVGLGALLIGASIGAVLLSLRRPAPPPGPPPAERPVEQALPEEPSGQPEEPSGQPEAPSGQPEESFALPEAGQPGPSPGPGEPAPSSQRPEAPAAKAPAEPPPVAAPPAEAPPAEAPPPGVATVSVRPGPASVVLVDPAGAEHTPGELPPGRYDIRATFGDGATAYGAIELRAGLSYTIACDAEFLRCR